MRTTTGPAARQAAYEKIRDLILTDPAVQGTFLTEANLVDTIGLSRTPIREALIMLDAEGFVELIAHRGAYIPPSNAREIRDTLEVRRLIEIEAARKILTAHRAPVVEMRRLLLEQDDLTVSEDNIPEFITIDQKFHATMVAAAKNLVMTDIYTRLRVKHVRFGISATWTSPSRPDEVLVEHRRILDALEEQNIENAIAAISAHIANTQALLLRGVDD